MTFTDLGVQGVKIAYIGGGSRGWAWGLMSDLANVDDMCGTVALYDIDKEAAAHNAIIGNRYKELPDVKSKWNYETADEIGTALTGADFVVISILPGTFDEMESDVHTPEKYGIYQSVGDTSGPGGIIRALRTLPMFQEFAQAIEKYCPDAWVINYTNPMSLCIRTLYKTFPKIKAFGCCHEVFGTRKFLANIVEEKLGVKNVTRDDIQVNVGAINHFTWITKAYYKNQDLFPIYREFCEEHAESGYSKKSDTNWMNNYFESNEKVKMDLFLRYGVIAAAGDRHLAEFCPGKWYLENPERVAEMQFGLTPVSWRKEDLAKRLEKSRKLVSGEEMVEIKETGEEGVQQMRSILGLRTLVTNVNMPNRGQIKNLPDDVIVETNAAFRSGMVAPIQTDNIPASIYQLVAKIVGEQETIAAAVIERDLNKAFAAFAADPLVTCSLKDAKKLFDEMVENTEKYLTMYNK